MIVEKIRIVNYRNYEELQLEMHPKLNIFVGENAQGKTNIIEAIYLCALGKSFRTNRDEEMINMNKKQSSIKIRVNKVKDQVLIELQIDREKNKKIKINKNPVFKTGELLGNFNVVLFSPEDLKIVKEGPAERRKFIDNEISQIFPNYYYTLNQYNKVLMQRNKFLKSKFLNKADIEIWDNQLVKHGSALVLYRKNFIQRISILARLMHRKITDGLETLEIKYESTFDIKDEDEIKNIKFNFLEKLKEFQGEEKRRNITLVGPHRDELIFTINGIDVKKYGSQGQQRTCVLSLKLAELELMKGEVGEYPVLLLDDVLSELDAKRQKYLLNSLKNVQTFITTTTVKHLGEENLTNKSVFYVSKGIASQYKD